MNYKTAIPMSAVLPPPPKKRKPKGITFPSILTADTGIHTLKTLGPIRFKVWYSVDGKKRYVTLPKDTTIEDARARRDRLYARMKEGYGAKRRKPKPHEVTAKPRTVSPLKPTTYIYHRPESWQVKFRGKLIGEGKTPAEAEAKRDAWLAANSHTLKP